MIARARARAPDATFVRDSIMDVELPSCVAATAVGAVLNYLPRRADVGTVLRRVYRALAPGGLLVFDVAGPGRAGPTGVRTGARVTEAWAVVATTRESRRGTLERAITTFSRDGARWRRTDERHRQNLYAAADCARLLRRIGFRTLLRRGYGAHRFGRDTAVFMARKPG
jgi:SAM-dependent methyltransferase